MMRYLTLGEVLELHGRVISQCGSLPGIRDRNALEAAVVQPAIARRTDFS